METPAKLRVDGAVARPLELGYDDFLGLPAADQVADVSRFQADKTGDAVTLDAILRLAAPTPEANYLTLHADRDDFHVSVPLEAIRAEAVLIYRLGDGPLTPERGGPVRFLVKNPAACHTDELDDCANVKYLSRIELTVRKGRDTRPEDEAAHAALHARQAEGG